MSARSRREKRRNLRVKRIIQRGRYRENSGYYARHPRPAKRRIKV